MRKSLIIWFHLTTMSQLFSSSSSGELVCSLGFLILWLYLFFFCQREAKSSQWYSQQTHQMKTCQSSTRGASHCGLAIYIKKYLKALWKLKYFTMQKLWSSKNPLKETKIFQDIIIFLYNRLGFVLGGSSFPSIHLSRHPSPHPSSSSLDEEDDGIGGRRLIMLAAAFFFFFSCLFRRAAQG